MPGPAAKLGETPSARPTDDALRLADRHLRTGNVPLAVAAYGEVLAGEPDNETALVRRGSLLCGLGRFAEGIEDLSRAVERRPDDDTARNNLIYACNAEFSRALSGGDFAAAATHCRRILALDPDHGGFRSNLSLCLVMSNQPATLADVAPGLDPAALGAKILVACMPKSGSTWLTGALQALTGFANTGFSFAYMQNEQELYLPHVIDHAARDTVTQQHCRATAANLQVMQAFAIRPVVLVRNLLDTLVSLNDFYVAGAVRNTFLYGDYDALDRAAKLDLVVDLVAPWYVQFYVSWALAEREGRVPLMWVTYEEMMADKPAALARIAGFHGLEKSAAEIAAALGKVDGDKAATRFNRGVSGRGERELSAGQIERVRRLTAYFPSVDFARIGLA